MPRVLWLILIFANLVTTSASERKAIAPGVMINPPGLYPTQAYGFSQAVKTPAKTLIFLSGQVGWRRDRTLPPPGDFTAQTEQALANISEILKSEGLDHAALLQMRLYVVDINPEKMRVLGAALQRFFATDYKPASTVIGISSLARPELLVEVEAIAAAP